MISESIKVSTPWAVLAASTIGINEYYTLLQIILMILAIAISIQTLVSREARRKRESKLADLVDQARSRCTAAAAGKCPMNDALKSLTKEKF